VAGLAFQGWGDPAGRTSQGQRKRLKCRESRHVVWMSVVTLSAMVGHTIQMVNCKSVAFRPALGLAPYLLDHLITKGVALPPSVAGVHLQEFTPD
jgi:hypothetical protein